MCFNICIVRVYKIQHINFQNHNTNSEKKNEFIDYLVDNVKNPRDVQDCVAVPRGIFKAYIYLMVGSSLGMISGTLPQKWKAAKIILNVACAVFSAISAVYFAKPFAIEGLSPTLPNGKIISNS